MTSSPSSHLSPLTPHPSPSIARSRGVFEGLLIIDIRSLDFLPLISSMNISFAFHFDFQRIGCPSPLLLFAFHSVSLPFVLDISLGIASSPRVEQATSLFLSHSSFHGQRDELLLRRVLIVLSIFLIEFFLFISFVLSHSPHFFFFFSLAENILSLPPSHPTSSRFSLLSVSTS